MCAFAPDGRAYFAIGSDNYVLTADKWRFTQAYGGATWQPPPDQGGTFDDDNRCAKASCMPACPGAPKIDFGGLCLDAGGGDAARD